MSDPINLLLLGAAIFLFWRLYSAFGTRTGTERPPFDPFAKTPAPAPSAPAPAADMEPPKGLPETPREPVWKGFAPEGSAIAQGLEKIAAADPSFSPKQFVAGAKTAYEMIIEAFANGDKAALKPLLSREVFEGFNREIDARAAAKRKLETRFVGIRKVDITEASVEGSRAILGLRFVAEIISATRNAANEVIEGHPQEVREIVDDWTFERDTTSRDPNWKLTGTENDA